MLILSVFKSVKKISLWKAYPMAEAGMVGFREGYHVLARFLHNPYNGYLATND